MCTMHSMTGFRGFLCCACTEDVEGVHNNYPAPSFLSMTCLRLLDTYTINIMFFDMSRCYCKVSGRGSRGSGTVTDQDISSL